MPYVTQAQLVTRFGSDLLIRRTDRSNTPKTTIDTDVVMAAIADAEALVDGYLGKVYALPLSVVPPILTRVAGDIAIYFLMGDTAEKDSSWHRAYREAMAWLADVSKGLIQLDEEGVAPAQTGGGAVRTSPGDRVFTRDSLKGM
jgi:phage gp36-like protein